MRSNLLAFLLTSSVCLAHLEICKYLARRNVCKRSTSRKLIHIGCGLQYLLLWPTYPDKASARFWCCAVPLVATVRYLMVGLGLLQDPALVLSTSRSGNRIELLKGPVVYGIVHSLSAALFWRTSSTGVLTITFLCAGDGLAEVVGSRLGGSNPLPHNPNKSWAGSLACLCGSFCCMMLSLGFFRIQGLWTCDETALQLTIKVLLISSLGTVVESLPWADWDNLAVSTVTAVLSRLLLSP